MRTTALTRMYLQFAATLVACAIFGLMTTASAQQPAAKVQGYAEIHTGHSNGSLNVDLWLQSGGEAELNSFEGHWPMVKAASTDGEAAVGLYAPSLKSSAKSDRLFLWTKVGGFREIAKFPFEKIPREFFVSNDGSLVTWVETEQRGHGKWQSYLVRWSKDGGVKNLAVAGDFLVLTGVSDDGSQIVGAVPYNGTSHGFRWTRQGGVHNFPEIDDPLAMSADGNIILGAKAEHIIRWTQVTGPQDLGTLKAPGEAIAFPESISADGTIVVGWLSIPSHDNVPECNHAFVWTRAGGLQDLGKPRGRSARLMDVSADGTVVAGELVADNGLTFPFVSTLADMVAKKQAELKKEQDQVATQAAAKAEEQAKNAAIAADQQARYDRVMQTGRPAQLYSLAGHMEDEGRPDLAANLYQALIDKFPDDPYTAKAIDKEDAARAAAAQQQQAQDSAGQAAANAASPQAVEACLQQCNSTLNSCKSDAQTQSNAAVAKGLVGLLSKNSGMVGGAGTDAQNADSAKSACEDAYNTCSTACQ